MKLMHMPTLWFGRMPPASSRFAARPNSMGPAVLTVWGWVPTHDGYRPKPRKKPKPSGSLRGFDTIWFRSKKDRPKLLVGVPLHADTVWGRLPLWDGRTASEWPDVAKRPNLTRQFKIGSHPDWH